jgi:hexosaminidase
MNDEFKIVNTGNGWQWGPLEGLGDLSLCVNAEPYRDYCIQPPCGQLNPLNPHTYDVLGNIEQLINEAKCNWNF